MEKATRHYFVYSIDLHMFQQSSAVSQIEAIIAARLIGEYVDHIGANQSIPRWQCFGVPLFTADQLENMMN